MKTVGQVLQEARTARKLSVDDVADGTRIPREHILHLERGQYDKLPPPPFVKGFIRNYAKHIGLDVLPLYALYRREVDVTSQTQQSALTGPIPLKRIRMTLTAKALFILGALVILIGFFGYLLYAYQSFAGAPLLLVTSPNDQAQVTQELLTVTGKVDPSATLTINDQDVPVRRNGQFSAEITIPLGLTELRIRAVNARGKETVVTRTVVREGS